MSVFNLIMLCCMVFGATLKKTNFLFYIITSEAEKVPFRSSSPSIVSVLWTWYATACLAGHQHKCKKVRSHSSLTTCTQIELWKREPLTHQSRFFFFNLFIYYLFWLCWVFIAAHGLSLVAVSSGYSLLRCAGFSLRWLLLLRSTGSRRAGFSSCGTRASVVVARRL